MNELERQVLIDILTEDRKRKYHMPQHRRSITHKFEILGETLKKVCPKCGHVIDEKYLGCKGYFTVGLKEDGSPGELFIWLAKTGETRRGFADIFALYFSYLLQYDVPLYRVVKACKEMTFEPFGYTKNPEIRTAKSIVDYIRRWMERKFPHLMLGHEEKNAIEKIEPSEAKEGDQGKAEAL